MILRYLLFIYLILSAGILRIQYPVSQDPSPHFIPYMNLRIIVRPVIDKQRRLSADHNRCHDRPGDRPREKQITENEYDRKIYDIEDHVFRDPEDRLSVSDRRMLLKISERSLYPPDIKPHRRKSQAL